MFGEDLLVAPVLNPDGDLTVYLPDGEWRRFPDRAALPGGRAHNLRLALGELAVFARAGTPIPLAPAEAPPTIDTPAAEVWLA
jgi:alpha-D-xyloside xylohydrolase